jgi:hypothetical protein
MNGLSWRSRTQLEASLMEIRALRHDTLFPHDFNIHVGFILLNLFFDPESESALGR